MSRTCRRCGSRLSEDDHLGGHCPECLVRVSLNVGVCAEGKLAVEEFPRLFGDYELLEEVARGGMGVVYRAREVRLDREVALKVTLSGPFAGPAALDRFRAEAQTVARLRHPNIVVLHEAGEAEGQPYFTMDFVKGQDLDRLVRSGPLPARQVARYVERIAHAVHYAHEQGVLHRDLKPSNVLIDELDEPRITDFGLAKRLAVDAPLTLSGQTLGSPNYMAPEQASRHHGAVGIRSDIYALGALIYQLATGRAPFVAGTVAETLHLVLHAEPAPPRVLNPTLPLDLETICMKCLQKDPGRRYPTALAVAEELDRFLEDRQIQARPVGRVEKVWRWCRRNRALSSALTVSGLLALMALGGILTQWRRAEESERLTRLNLYAADMMAASYAIARGDLGLGGRLLEAHLPRPGELDLRGFEWRYFWPRCMGEHRATLMGHKWIVTCAAYSPDGGNLISGSQDGTVRIWDDLDGTGSSDVLKAHDGAVWTVQFTPQGNRFVTGGSDGKVHLWDYDTHEIIRTFKGRMACLSPVGTRMAIVDSDLLYWTPEGEISVWDYEANQKLNQLPGTGKSMAISPDGRILAVAQQERDVRLWEIASGELVKTLATEEQVWCPMFSPNGSQLATGSLRAAYVWHLAGAGAPTRLNHPLTVWSTGFSPDGTLLVTTSSDRAVRFWDSQKLSLERTARGHTDEVWCLAFSPDGTALATGGKDQSVRLWAHERKSEAVRIRHAAFERPQYSPDGRYLVTQVITNDRTESLLWVMREPWRSTLIPGQPVVGFTPDSRQVVGFTGAIPAMALRPLDDLRDARSIPLELEGDDGPYLRLGLSPDGGRMFVISASGRIFLFEVPSGRRCGSIEWPVIKRSEAGKFTIRSAALSVGGRRFAISTEQSAVVQLFEVSSGREIQLIGHQDFVSGIAFSPDGELLATGSVDASIRLWSAKDGRNIATLTGHMEEATDVAFSPDGRTLASVGFHSTVMFWHVPTFRELAALDFPKAGFHLVFSPDGEALAVTTGAQENEGVEVFAAPALP